MINIFVKLNLNNLFMIWHFPSCSTKNICVALTLSKNTNWFSATKNLEFWLPKLKFFQDRLGKQLPLLRLKLRNKTSLKLMQNRMIMPVGSAAQALMTWWMTRPNARFFSMISEILKIKFSTLIIFTKCKISIIIRICRKSI
jgi:hypothetical protein